MKKCKNKTDVYRCCPTKKPNDITVFNAQTAHVQLGRGLIALISPCDINLVRVFRWSADTRGYPRTEILRRVFILSRYLMGLDDPWTGLRTKGLCVDHIDGDPINNRRENLRICTLEQNHRNINCRGYHRNSDGSYAAYIRVNQELIYLGRAYTEEGAQRLRRDAELKYCGEYAVRRGKEWLNFAID